MAQNYIKTLTINTPLGEMLLGEDDNKICLCVWKRHSKRTAIEHRLQRLLKKKFMEMESPLLLEAGKQINEFLAGQRTSFGLKTMLVGSEFQQEVWKRICATSYGDTMTFKQLAQTTQKEDAIRPLAAAVASNPLALLTPSHRIVGETKPHAPGAENKADEKLRELERPKG